MVEIVTRVMKIGALNETQESYNDAERAVECETDQPLKDLTKKYRISRRIVDFEMVRRLRDGSTTSRWIIDFEMDRRL